VSRTIARCRQSNNGAETKAMRKVKNVYDWLFKRESREGDNSIAYLGYPDAADLGHLVSKSTFPDAMFEAYEPDNYSWEKRVKVAFDQWPTIKPVHSENNPPIQTLLPVAIRQMLAPEDILEQSDDQRRNMTDHEILNHVPHAISSKLGVKKIRIMPKDELVDECKKYRDARWGKFVEPSGTSSTTGPVRGAAGNTTNPRGLKIGQRKGYVEALGQPVEKYRPQTRLTQNILTVKHIAEDAIATERDWAHHRELERVNAVTFRCDSRSPNEVIKLANGFRPATTRNDVKYIEGNVADEFQYYMRERYHVHIDTDKIKAAIRGDVNFQSKSDIERPRFENLLLKKRLEYQSILNQYQVWFSLVRKESAHLSRMTENQFEKNWISTSKCLDRAAFFLPKTDHGNVGWVYVVIVHSGFVVPCDKMAGRVIWATPEAEIAEYGGIPSNRIVGFAHVTDFAVDTPIFWRPDFLNDEKVACKAMHRALSGANSTAPYQ
jgi:hypothetical protein